ncbi:hypothetical protein DEU56DRAFT_952555 [Suillus clintonianus]|uniref:uncharacterized protein n=1 Tax=Suillus clintonianus TaxID=1904413 RepID=UPI001B881219|nr:uncharacterized protein DEU56DRAFT_952555 [Suillus clintonianus]KAG2132341.1 hypothetical protein DEU56DRAFT_952555 [Suillus clintonianus]
MQPSQAIVGKSRTASVNRDSSYTSDTSDEKHPRHSFATSSRPGYSARPFPECDTAYQTVWVPLSSGLDGSFMDSDGGVTSELQREILTITAMLSVPDVWLGPNNQLTEADAAKTLLTVPDGDHLTLLNLYNDYTQNQYHKHWTWNNYLSARALMQADNIREQLIRHEKAFWKERLARERGDQSRSMTTTIGDEADTALLAIAAAEVVTLDGGVRTWPNKLEIGYLELL